MKMKRNWTEKTRIQIKYSDVLSWRIQEMNRNNLIQKRWHHQKLKAWV